ncbi:hypothetical protein E8E11_006905 [Didymella keratinophila]|nr:hypothetical protein E8E11_006905 [Didymella keratinophila]
MVGRTSGISLDEKTPHDQTKDIDSTKDALSVDTDAVLGLQQENELTVGKAFWYYRKAVCWSIMISLANIMESYDIQLIKAFYAFPRFNKKYGF